MSKSINPALLYRALGCLAMVLAKQFVTADICETLPNIWVLTITYSYYGLYQYTSVSTHNSLQKAKDRLLAERCGTNLRITDKAGLNIVLA